MDLEQRAVIYPPNRQMEKVITFSNEPLMYEYLLFIDFNNRGEVILSSSNITGTYWNGTLFHYKSPELALQNDYSGYYVTNSSITSGKCFRNYNRVVIAEDNKYLKLLMLPENNNNMPCQDYYMNSERIRDISLEKKNNKYIYTCSGNSVTIWDVDNDTKLYPLENYQNVHTETVTSIDASHHSVDLFATCSADRRACLWDIRLNAAATVLYVNEFSTLTTVAWHPLYSHLLVVGSTAGDIYLLDKRQPKEFCSVYHCFDNKIYNLVFNNKELAVCGDTSSVHVLNCSEEQIMSKSIFREHTNMVRSIAWYGDYLYSCGFDKKIVQYFP